VFEALDPLLHAQLRLAITSLLVGLESAEFSYLLEKTEATKGNLSVQLTKLRTGGCLGVNKSFRNNYPLTTCNITDKGAAAFQVYVDAVSSCLQQ
jgi:hypothetical protein